MEQPRPYRETHRYTIDLKLLPKVPGSSRVVALVPECGNCTAASGAPSARTETHVLGARISNRFPHPASLCRAKGGRKHGRVRSTLLEARFASVAHLWKKEPYLFLCQKAYLALNHGIVSFYKGQYEEAEFQLRMALDVYPLPEEHALAAFMALTFVYSRTSQLKLAERTMITLAERFKGHPEVGWRFAGLAIAEKANRKACKEGWDEVSEAESDWLARSTTQGMFHFLEHYAYASQFAEKGDYDRAKADWLRSLELAPFFVISAFDLFDAACDEGDLETAADMGRRIELYLWESPVALAIRCKLAERLTGTTIPARLREQIDFFLDGWIPVTPVSPSSQRKGAKAKVRKRRGGLA